MSCSFVRSTVRQWCSDVAAATGDVFHDTINTRVKPTESVWWTVEFFADEIDGTFCKNDYLEVGSVTVVVMAQPGLGDAAAIAALERIVPAMYDKVDPKLAFISWIPIFEDSAGSADRYYRVASILNYQYSNQP